MGAAAAWLTGRTVFGRTITEKAARIITRIAFGLAVLLLLAGAVTVARCSSGNQQRVQDKVNDAQAGAFTNSAADAIATEQNASARERASDELSRTNEEEIRNAPGANAPVDPGVRDAGLRSLCRRAAYRDSPRCKLLKPAP